MAPKFDLKLEAIPVEGYEKVVYVEEPRVGLNAIIAVHNTNLGPACGGVRMLPYANRSEALEDVLRLSKGMSYKSALAGIGFGGGKSVIILDPAKKTKELFHAFGQFLETFGGRYIGAKDMNISTPDLAEIKTQTKHVLGVEGEKGTSGDPSPVTARGCLRALEATVEALSGTKSLSGIKVALQGIGHVGYSLAERVVNSGGEIWVTDVDEKSLAKAKNELGANVVGLDEIYDVPCDIFSPCARGATLNAKTIPRLKCRAIVGCANNQLATPADGMNLFERGILYAPDFAVNSGGIINIFVEFEGYSESKAFAMADNIYDTMKTIFTRAKSEKAPPFVVADRLAEERLYGKR